MQEKSQNNPNSFGFPIGIYRGMKQGRQCADVDDVSSWTIFIASVQP